MHTDLSPHLHTPHCNQLIRELKKCHEEVCNLQKNTFAKFLGVCNTIDSAVVKCLKQERIARSAANRAKARERQEELKRRINQSQ